MKYNMKKTVYANNLMKTPMPSLLIEMEYLPYDLFDAHYNNRIHHENKKKIARSMIHAVNFLHQNNIIHGDIKLENMLLTKTQDAVKLIDFESSIYNTPPDILKTLTLKSTIEYCSPEFIFKKKLGFHNDIWALGLCLFLLFESRDCIDHIDMIREEKTPHYYFVKTPPLYVDIIKKCLIYEYNHRITIDIIMSLLKNDEQTNFIPESKQATKVGKTAQ